MADGKLSVSDTFARAFAAVHANPLVCFGVMLVASALPRLLASLLTINLAYDGTPPAQAIFTHPVILAAALVAFLIGLIGQGAVIRATLAHAEDHKTSFGEALSAGLRFYLPLLGMTILAGIGLTFSAILFVFPMFMLATMWAVAGPAIVAENLGPIEAFGRSRELTKGSRWRIFALFVLFVIIVSLVSMAYGFVALLLGASAGLFAQPTSFSLTATLLQLVINVVIGTYSLSLFVALYVELRNLRGAAEPDQLADVFA